MKLIVLAKSSSGEPYNVEFMLVGNSIRIFCHCPAGVTQQVCKHKLGLIKGDTEMLFDPTQAEELAEIQTAPEFAKLRERVDEFEKRMSEIEAAKSALTKTEKSIKAELARGFAVGF